MVPIYLPVCAEAHLRLKAAHAPASQALGLGFGGQHAASQISGLGAFHHHRHQCCCGRVGTQ